MASHPAEFIHQDPLDKVNVPLDEDGKQDCHQHPDLKRKLYSALQESIDGELSIAIPKEVSVRQSGRQPASDAIYSEGELELAYPMSVFLMLVTAATPEPQTPGASHVNGVPTEFAPITVNISYSIRKPVDGVEFVLPTDSYPYVRVPRLIYLHHTHLR